MIRKQGWFPVWVGGGLASVLAVLFACSGCQDGYPIPATQCDEWCDASQPTFCGDYDPAACVLECSQRGGDAIECRAELDTLLACLRAHSAYDLACETRLNEGTPPPCLDEERAYELCTGPHSQGG